MDNASLGITVVIPAKNEEMYLAECLKALNASLANFPNHEIIVVDNGSVDKTIEIARQFGCIVFSKPNGNISAMRNLGAKSAKYPYLAFLDADCLVHSSWAKFCLQIMIEDKEIGVVGTRAVPDLNNATWVEENLCILFSGSEKRPSYVKWLGSSNMILTLKTFQDAGGFDEALLTSEDVAFCTQVRRNGKKIFLEKRVNTLHLRESKTLSDLYRREVWRGKHSILSFIKNSFPQEEIPSVAVPFVVFISFVVLLTAILFPKLCGAWWCSAAVIIFMPVALVIKNVGARRRTILAWLRLYCVSFVYLFARAMAVALGFRDLFGKK